MKPMHTRRMSLGLMFGKVGSLLLQMHNKENKVDLNEEQTGDERNNKDDN